MEVTQQCLIPPWPPFIYFPSLSFPGRFFVSVFYRDAICLLLGFLPSARFPPTFHTLLIFPPLIFLSLFLPDACTHTHTTRHTESSWYFLFFPHPLFFLPDGQAKHATRTACSHDMKILQKQPLYFHQERPRRWGFFYWPQRFLLP